MQQQIAIFQLVRSRPKLEGNTGRVPLGDAFKIAVPLGLLVGVLSGFVVLLLLREVTRPYRRRISYWEQWFGQKGGPSIFKIITRIMSLPAFWFGGPWVGAKMFDGLDWAALLPSYLFALVATFLLVVGYPLIQRRLGQVEGTL